MTDVSLVSLSRHRGLVLERKSPLGCTGAGSDSAGRAKRGPTRELCFLNESILTLDKDQIDSRWIRLHWDFWSLRKLGQGLNFVRLQVARQLAANSSESVFGC